MIPIGISADSDHFYQLVQGTDHLRLFPCWLAFASRVSCEI